MKIVKYIFIALVFIVVSFPEIEEELENSNIISDDVEFSISDKIASTNNYYWESRGCGFITKIIFNANGSFTATTMLEFVSNKKMIYRGKWKQGDANTKIYADYNTSTKQYFFSFDDDFTVMTRNDGVIFMKEIDNLFQ